MGVDVKRRTMRARKSSRTVVSTPLGMRVDVALAVDDLPGASPADAALVRVWWFGAKGATTFVLDTGTTVQAPAGPGLAGVAVYQTNAAGVLEFHATNGSAVDDTATCVVEVVGEREQSFAMLFDHA